MNIMPLWKPQLGYLTPQYPATKQEGATSVLNLNFVPKYSPRTPRAIGTGKGAREQDQQGTPALAASVTHSVADLEQALARLQKGRNFVQSNKRVTLTPHEISLSRAVLAIWRANCYNHDEALVSRGHAIEEARTECQSGFRSRADKLAREFVGAKRREKDLEMRKTAERETAAGHARDIAALNADIEFLEEKLRLAECTAVRNLQHHVSVYASRVENFAAAGGGHHASSSGPPGGPVERETTATASPRDLLLQRKSTSRSFGIEVSTGGVAEMEVEQGDESPPPGNVQGAHNRFQQRQLGRFSSPEAWRLGHSQPRPRAEVAGQPLNMEALRGIKSDLQTLSFQFLSDPKIHRIVQATPTLGTRDQTSKLWVYPRCASPT
ncbi:unnamed protein product [Amoebophrya sp. A120]|nr:unnamed protein product [Amoebophrya sp. A120]|eukprot:GSA120T00002213001.1